MTRPSSDVAFSPAVKAVQAQRGSRERYARVEEKGGWRTTVTPDLAGFLAEVRSFYLATASANGQPYVQHRGGPPGFLRVVDERTLGFAPSACADAPYSNGCNFRRHGAGLSTSVAA